MSRGMANTLKLEVGKRYLARDGREVLINGFDAEPGIEWPFEGVCDGVQLTWKSNGAFFDCRAHDTDLIEEIVEPAYRYFRRRAHDTDLIEEIVEPAYRYFRRRDDNRSYKCFVIWRSAPGDWLVEGWLPNKQGDEWSDTDLSLTGDLLFDPNIIECDSEGLILGRPEPVAVAASEDLTPEQRTRIAKLAARIVLADGPMLSIDELASMTVGALVTRLEDCVIHSI